MEDGVFRDFGIEMINYKRDWTKEVNSKERIWVISSLFSSF